MNLIFLVGCLNKTPSNETKITGEVIKDAEKQANESVVTQKKSDKTIPAKNQTYKRQSSDKLNKTSEIKQSDKYYDLKKLEDDINQIINITYNFTRDPSHPDYVRSSQLKYYIIHTMGNKENFTNNVGKFCGRYCAADWNGWQYYINMSRYKSLFPLLGRENFSSEEKYREYLREGTFINYTFVETSYDVANGKVLEYQLISWRLDNSFKYFEGAYDGTFLIYKIYCSPNMTILLTPRWEIYKMQLPAMTLEDSYKTWNDYIISARKDLLNKSNELLKRCSVNKEFFENYKFPDYYKSEMLTGHRKVYYNKMFKLNSSLSASAKSKSNGKYVLNQVNVSFTNIDEVDLWNAAIDEGVNLKIEVTPDSESTKDYWDRRVTGILEPGKSITRSYQHKEIEFFDNITIRAVLYVEGNVETPAVEKTFTKEDFVKG